MNTPTGSNDPRLSDDALVKTWPGFTSRYIDANGVRLHYVDGGSGPAIVCLPGWPQTWYSYHAIAPVLAETYRVIVVDIRGMGSSEKPETGYDKKTMAADIAGLLRQLEVGPATIIGHDIGGMVAVSLAQHFPEVASRLVLMDGMHPGEGMAQMPLLPAAGTFGEKMDGRQPYAWWMSFNQVRGLPEQLLVGRFRIWLDYLFRYVMIDDGRMTALERDVYEAQYDNVESIRAANAWYQAFAQDIEDSKGFRRLDIPVLGIASYISAGMMSAVIPMMSDRARSVAIMDSGHYLMEEQPAAVLEALSGFL